MPELPEVETIRRQLNAALKEKKIVGVEVRWGKKIEPTAGKLQKMVVGATFGPVNRRGKLLIFTLSNGNVIVAHLKMTGRFLIKPKGSEPTKHTHVIFRLSGPNDLHWEDVRKFGFLKAFDAAGAMRFVESWKFGPEPLSPSFTFETMRSCLIKYPKAKIKPKLMEQKCIAGIGNIYATESLWSAGIHPLTQIKNVPEVKLKKLHSAVRDVMKRAVAARGTSSDNYLDAFGEEGEFVNKLKAYGREGEPCRRCGTPLAKIKVGGRGSAYCPKCQKLKI